MLFSNQQWMVSSALLFLGFFCIVGSNNRHKHGFIAAQATDNTAIMGILEDYDFSCDSGPDALTNAFGKYIPQTCIDVPVLLNDDGSVSTTMKRCYYTYVPESCKNNNNIKKLPLVLDLHGLGSCALFSAGYSGWMQQAEEDCFVVVWPSGTNDGQFLAPCFNIPGFLISENRGTEGGNNVITAPCCCFEDFSSIPTRDPDDPLFLKTAIESVIESFETTNNNESLISIDRNRVYMAGHSNGCMTSLAMAALYSDTIAAVCCHAGALLTPFPVDYSPVPIWLAHGMKDDVVPFEGSALIELPPFGALGFWSMGDTMDYLSNQNDCLEVEEIDIIDNTNETGIVGTVLRRTNCRKNATVELVALFESGHSPYPRSNGPIGRETRTTIDTTAMAWEFCSSHVSSSHLQESPVTDETLDVSEDDGVVTPLLESETKDGGGEKAETETKPTPPQESLADDGKEPQNETPVVDSPPLVSSAPRNEPGMFLTILVVVGGFVTAPFLVSPV